MMSDYSYKESLLFSLDNDYNDENSINQILSQNYQKEYIKEQIKNYPYTFNNFIKTDSPKQLKFQINNNNNKEKWSKIFCTNKENINEEDIDPKSLYFVNNNQNDLKNKNEKVLFFEDYEFLPQQSTLKRKKRMKKINLNNKNNIFDNSSQLFINNKNNDENINTINNKNTEKNDKIQDNTNLLLLNKNDNQTKPKKTKRGAYKKKKLFQDKINFEDECFPFTTGKGVINITTKFNYDFPEYDAQDNKQLSSCEFSDEKTNVDLNINFNINEKAAPISVSENDLYLMKFVTKKYYYSENGRRKRVKKKRKYKSDIIRKKIKSRFHKSLRNIINENLKKAGSQMLFDCLPQCFIGNTSILLNSKCFELTYRELLLNDFGSELINYRHTPKDNEKYLKNVNVLKYLEQNPEISKKSGFDIIKGLKYKDILKNYFISAEFEQSLEKLKTENEPQEYIQSYIYRAKNYLKFYNNFRPTYKDKFVDIEYNKKEEMNNEDFETDNDNFFFYEY